MQTWFLKSLLATITIVPSFIAIPFFKHRYGLDPLVFVVWYFGGTALSIALFFVATGRGTAVLPPWPLPLAILAIGMVFGAVANGSLFQAVGLAPNPGLPPVVYASSSMIVYALSAVLAASFPDLFKRVSVEPERVAGMVLVLVGLYLLAGGGLKDLFGGR
jgi:drug/metabolite transporter (DMT)-like permease